MEHIPNIISSKGDLGYFYYCFDAGRMSKIYFLLVINGVYFLDNEDSFPLDKGRTAGSYYTFFNEFFLISDGFLSLLLLNYD